MVVGRPYGIIDEEATNSAGVRATYFIDPEGVIRAITQLSAHNRALRGRDITHGGGTASDPLRAQDWPLRTGGKSSGSSYRPTKRSSKKPTGFAGAKYEAHLTIPESRLNTPPIRNANQLNNGP